jgi:hypothetical protein
MNFLGYTWADKNRNLDRATDLLERANALDPGNQAYRDSLGWVYYRAQDGWLEAETILGSVALKANDPVVWSHYGDVARRSGKKKPRRFGPGKKACWWIPTTKTCSKSWACRAGPPACCRNRLRGPC